MIIDVSFVDALGEGTGNDVLLILNSGEDVSVDDLFLKTWKRCFFHVCADGGANRLYDRFKTDESRVDYIPDKIVGDLDSLRSEVRDFYEGLGADILHLPSQDKHDMDKSLDTIYELQNTREMKVNVLVLGACGGRLDQEFGNLNMLYRWSGEFASIYLLREYSLVFLVPVGESSVVCSRSMVGEICGLIPLGSPLVRISTDGLKWDLNEAVLKFGGLVSSSNKIMKKELRINSDAPVLLTCSYNKNNTDTSC